MDLIREDNTVSTEKISEILNVSSKTVKRHIKKITKIKFVESGYSGHWEITE